MGTALSPFPFSSATVFQVARTLMENFKKATTIVAVAATPLIMHSFLRTSVSGLRDSPSSPWGPFRMSSGGTGCGSWMCHSPWHSLFSAEGHQKASGTCLVSRWDSRGAEGHCSALSSWGSSRLLPLCQLHHHRSGNLLHHSPFLCWHDPHVIFSENPSDLLTLLIHGTFPKVFQACGSCQ